MAKHIAKIPLSEIRKMAIAPSNGAAMAAIKGDADYIINAGFYDMSSYQAVGHLKIDGKVKSEEEWSCWGYAWNNGEDVQLTEIPKYSVRNYISGVELITPWMTPDKKLSYLPEVGGSRPRSAIALTKDSLILYCTDKGTTPEQLREELKNMGAESALMLDSGGSSQCDFNGKTIKSTRKVHNYICVWGSEKPMSKKVVLDPGHGAETAGKRSPDGTYLEHEFNLDMANRVKAELERHGVEVVMTRTTPNDVTLANRVKISNSENPDLFVSIHSNASGNGWTAPSGFGIYTSVAGDTAERNKAAKKIIARAKEANIGLWGDGLFHDASLYVLKNTTAPAVLIEHGFHTNKVEVEKLKSPQYRAELASVDAKGILDYMGIPYVEKPVESKFCTCPWCGKPISICKGE